MLNYSKYPHTKKVMYTAYFTLLTLLTFFFASGQVNALSLTVQENNADEVGEIYENINSVWEKLNTLQEENVKLNNEELILTENIVSQEETHQLIVNQQKLAAQHLRMYAKEFYIHNTTLHTSVPVTQILFSPPEMMENLIALNFLVEKFEEKVEEQKTLDEQMEGSGNELVKLNTNLEQVMNEKVKISEQVKSQQTRFQELFQQLNTALEKQRQDDYAKNICNDTSTPEDKKISNPPTSPTPHGFSQKVINASFIWDFFTKKGFTPEAVAGILGNLEQESQLNPYAQQPSPGVGRGLAQWSEGGRWNVSKPLNLIGYAQKNNLNPWTVETQTLFIHEEMLNGWGGFNMDEYRTSTNVGEATKYFHDRYEKSADTPQFVSEVRGKYAQRWYELFLEKQVTPTSAENSIPTPTLIAPCFEKSTG